MNSHSKNDRTDYIYGRDFVDRYLMHDLRSLLRYGHLARKALIHYGRDKYNPHEHGLTLEISVREIIKEIIGYKVLYKTKAYDWEWIDNTLKKFIGGCLEIDLPYNQSRIDASFNQDAKAKTLIDWKQQH